MTDKDKSDYVSPDEYMKNKEYYDHKAMESRHRVISNASNNRL